MNGGLRAASALVLFAVLLAQVPWFTCDCGSDCAPVAAIQAPTSAAAAAGARACSACSCHRAADAATPGPADAPGERPTPLRGRHGIETARLWSGASTAAPSGAHAAPSAVARPVDARAMRACVAAWHEAPPVASGPPAALTAVRLLL